MKYIICQDWANTTNNHAGMKYLAIRLKAMYPDEYDVLVVPDFYAGIFQTKNALLHRFLFYSAKVEYLVYLRKLTKILMAKLKHDDSVFLFEYLEKMTPELYLAKHIKKKFPNMEINAIVHLTPKKLEKAFKTKELETWLKPISKVITLGSSLTTYLVKRGFNANRILTTFHYVDMQYYHRNTVSDKDKVSVIAMGNQMRNIRVLKKIIKNNPNVLFTVCQGVLNMSEEFSGIKNVRLIPFVEEDELKRYMEESDISLNVMNDTIGSNVIVTSMAMGLAMVCSDVGSIRDYCNETNSFFCSNDDEDSFSKAIHTLSTNLKLLKCMKFASVNKARTLSIERFKESLDCI